MDILTLDLSYQNTQQQHIKFQNLQVHRKGLSLDKVQKDTSEMVNIKGKLQNRRKK